MRKRKQRENLPQQKFSVKVTVSITFFFLIFLNFFKIFLINFFKTELVSSTLRTVVIKLIYSPTRFVSQVLVLQVKTKRLYL